jgi:RNA polymerase sigma factor (sigma-70 family)
MTVIENPATDAGVGDIEELYGLFARRLEHIVRLDVRAPEVVIEDACQFAWSRLVHHRHRVHRETVMSWLARTAVHEAFKLLRRDRREVSLEADCEQAAPALTPRATLNAAMTFSSAMAPHDLVETRERLSGLRRLPERQQRVLWLHALGLSYAEIAVHEACTVRTVERQLVRARHRLRNDT